MDPSASPSASRPAIPYDKAPFLIIWEMTRACPLACSHCRAEAVRERHPLELSTDEAKKLLDQAHALGTRVFIFTGGDPFSRPDLAELVAYGHGLGMRMAAIGAASPREHPSILRELKQAGLAQFALSLDGSTPEIHDSFRGVRGTWEETLRILDDAQAVGLPVQVNTVLCRYNWADFPRVIDLIQRLGIVFWEIFFLIPTGRGRRLRSLTARQYEEAFAQIYEVQKKAGFIVKVTEGFHYKRYVLQQEYGNEALAKVLADGGQAHLPAGLTRREGPGGSIGLAQATVNAGKGFCFISHVGEVYPSGFLPLSAGNVRTRSLAELYQETPLFQALRDPNRLEGKCGRCEFRNICGGSRSRAYAVTGNPFAAEPFCSYRPGSLGRKSDQEGSPSHGAHAV